MIDNKRAEINKLCDNLASVIRNKVVFVNGLKPINYYMPDIHLGTRVPNDEIILAWFSEIWVNDECVFRESSIPSNDEKIDIVEQKSLDRLLQSIFNYGIMASKNFIDEYKKNNP